MKEEDGKITMTPLPNEERAIRSMSFGLVAEEYDRYRPKLPEAALDWLLPPECQTALDLGAGTGAATRVLARRVPHVISVEPDPRMRAVIARDTPQAQVLEGRAEAIPLKDGSVDVVLVCSAWHWMDPDLAVPEIARVLRPGGVWGIMWNGLDREVPWVAELRNRIRHSDPDEERLDAHRPENVLLPEGAPFLTPQIDTIPWTGRTNVHNLLGALGTFSSVIILPPEERAEVLARARRFLDSHFAGADGEMVSVPMSCRCWKAVRL